MVEFSQKQLTFCNKKFLLFYFGLTVFFYCQEGGNGEKHHHKRTSDLESRVLLSQRHVVGIIPLSKMEQGAGHMPEVPAEEAASGHRFLERSGRPRLRPHDRLPSAVPWLEGIHPGAPGRERLGPFHRRIVGRRREGVGTPRAVNSQGCRDKVFI